MKHQRLTDRGCYRGLRLIVVMMVSRFRGQRTKANARTRKSRKPIKKYQRGD